MTGLIGQAPGRVGNPLPHTTLHVVEEVIRIVDFSKSNLQSLPAEAVDGSIDTLVIHIHIYTEEAVGSPGSRSPAIEHSPVGVTWIVIVVANAEDSMAATLTWRAIVRNTTKLVYVVNDSLILGVPGASEISPGRAVGQVETEPHGFALIQHALDIGNGSCLVGHSVSRQCRNHLILYSSYRITWVSRNRTTGNIG